MQGAERRWEGSAKALVYVTKCQLIRTSTHDINTAVLFFADLNVVGKAIIRSTSNRV
jgi:hypothetical protein